MTRNTVTRLPRGKEILDLSHLNDFKTHLFKFASFKFFGNLHTRCLLYVGSPPRNRPPPHSPILSPKLATRTHVNLPALTSFTMIVDGGTPSIYLPFTLLIPAFLLALRTRAEQGYRDRFPKLDPPYCDGPDPGRGRRTWVVFNGKTMGIFRHW